MIVPPLNWSPALSVSGFVKVMVPPFICSCWMVTPGAMSCVSEPLPMMTLKLTPPLPLFGTSGLVDQATGLLQPFVPPR